MLNYFNFASPSGFKEFIPWRLCNLSISSAQGVRNIASVCLQIGYPTLASIPHSVINGYKRVLAVSVETDYSFPLAEKVKLGSLSDRRLQVRLQNG